MKPHFIVLLVFLLFWVQVTAQEDTLQVATCKDVFQAMSSSREVSEHPNMSTFDSSDLINFLNAYDPSNLLTLDPSNLFANEPEYFTWAEMDIAMADDGEPNYITCIHQHLFFLRASRLVVYNLETRQVVNLGTTGFLVDAYPLTESVYALRLNPGGSAEYSAIVNVKTGGFLQKPDDGSIVLINDNKILLHQSKPLEATTPFNDFLVLYDVENEALTELDSCVVSWEEGFSGFELTREGIVLTREDPKGEVLPSILQPECQDIARLLRE
jgi:hypothetical protein